VSDCCTLYSDISTKVDVMFKPIPVTDTDTALDLIQHSLQKFGIEVGSRILKQNGFVCKILH